MSTVQKVLRNQLINMAPYVPIFIDLLFHKLNNHCLLRMENIYGCNFDHDNYYHFVRKAAFSKLSDQTL